MQTLTAEIDLVIEECCTCGTPFAMTKDLQRRRKRDHKWFYCPHGHAQYYHGKSETEKLQERLAAAQQREETLREQRDQAERSRRATQGHLTRHKKRAAAGTCPCCQRTFRQLSTHMRRQHPEYVEAHGVRAPEANDTT